MQSQFYWSCARSEVISKIKENIAFVDFYYSGCTCTWPNDKFRAFRNANALCQIPIVLHGLFSAMSL